MHDTDQSSLRHYTSHFSRIYEVILLNSKGLDVTKVVIVASNEINLTDLVQRPIGLTIVTSNLVFAWRRGCLVWGLAHKISATKRRKPLMLKNLAICASTNAPDTHL